MQAAELCVIVPSRIRYPYASETSAGRRILKVPITAAEEARRVVDGQVGNVIEGEGG